MVERTLPVRNNGGASQRRYTGSLIMSHDTLTRRTFLAQSAAVGIVYCSLPSRHSLAQPLPAPQNNPVAAYKFSWTDEIKWRNSQSIAEAKGDTLAAQLAAAQAELAAKGGGVIFFPPGTYEFKDHIKLLPGIVLRGADPPSPDATDDRYLLPTKFEFPKYAPILAGDGAPLDSAFKGISLADPLASNCGVVNIAINRGHIHFESTPEHKSGRNRLVYGCTLRNAATADKAVPDLKFGQHAWQRFTARHHAAINVHGAENILVANNRLPKSGDDNFSQDGYLLKGDKNAKTPLDGIVFDYDNRPGLYVNDFSIGAGGGSPPDGTPETHPWGFAKGIHILHNYIYATGRCPISFTGDGTICSFNVIRLAKDVWRPTTTGLAITKGSATNDNRGVQMRGWRWTLEGNDYEVYRNWAADKKYLINDGEGLMHEDHVNSIVKDSKIINNRGNAYIGIYKTGGIDGLLVEGNEVPNIMVVADRNSGRHECKNVTIANNVTTDGGIQIGGQPASNNVVRGNKATKPGSKLENRAAAKLENNVGYEVVEG